MEDEGRLHEPDGDNRPRRIVVQGKILDVIEIEDRWFGDGYWYARVFASDAKRYIVKMEVSQGENGDDSPPQGSLRG